MPGRMRFFRIHKFSLLKRHSYRWYSQVQQLQSSGAVSVYPHRQRDRISMMTSTIVRFMYAMT